MNSNWSLPGVLDAVVTTPNLVDGVIAASSLTLTLALALHCILWQSIMPVDKLLDVAACSSGARFNPF